jgi:hypothetical protein
MNPEAFLALSTRLCTDLKEWIGVAHKDGVLNESDLGLLETTMKIIERATLKDIEGKTPT